MWWRCECSNWSGIVDGRCACGARHCSERVYLSGGGGSRGQLLAETVRVSPTTGEICVCTASLAKGGVFKEFVMLNRCVCSTGPYTWGCQHQQLPHGNLMVCPMPALPARQGMGRRKPSTDGTCAVHYRKILPDSVRCCAKAGCPASEGICVLLASCISLFILFIFLVLFCCIKTAV